MRIIDFENPLTFPQELTSIRLNDYVADETMIIKNRQWWEIAERLHSLKLEYSNEVKVYIQNHSDDEIIVNHCSRILSIDEFRYEGLIIGGVSSSEEKRIRHYLKIIELDEASINNVMDKVQTLWSRDGKQRTKSVHFFVPYNLAYEDDQINAFALNLGGEVLRWAIESIGTDLYKQEPYKRLWLLGQPSIVRFKVSWGNLDDSCRNRIVSEIIMHTLATQMNVPYYFQFTGMTSSNIPPQNILSIDEIKDFVRIQEKHSEYKGFY